MNKYKEYPKEIRQLLYWNFINVEDVEQRHIDAYLARIQRQPAHKLVFQCKLHEGATLTVVKTVKGGATFSYSGENVNASAWQLTLSAKLAGRLVKFLGDSDPDHWYSMFQESAEKPFLYGRRFRGKDDCFLTHALPGGADGIESTVEITGQEAGELLDFLQAA